MKTYSAKPAEIDHAWYLIDAKDQTLGRLASEVAKYLQGKHKPAYTAHIDTGDNVIIINAGQIKVTGDKLAQKKYYRHSGHPGGLKETSLATLLEHRPEDVITRAVRGMMPHNRLSDIRLKRLKVYAGSEHPHDPQKPKALEVGRG